MLIDNIPRERLIKSMPLAVYVRFKGQIEQIGMIRAIAGVKRNNSLLTKAMVEKKILSADRHNPFTVKVKGQNEYLEFWIE